MPGSSSGRTEQRKMSQNDRNQPEHGWLKALLFDPGLGFAVSNILLFASTGGVPGLVISSVAAVLIAGANLANQVPKKMPKNSILRRVVQDPATPNRIAGAGLLAITVSGVLTALTSPAGLVAGGGLSALKAAGPVMWFSSFTGMSFAVANFRIASSLKQSSNAEPENRQSSMSVIQRSSRLRRGLATAKMLAKSPDTYIALGLMGLGLIAGGWSMLAFPAVLAGYARTVRNSINAKPQHNGHPKLYYSLAGMVFSTVGLMNGNILPALSNMVATYAVTNVEARLTPGGFSQLLTDVKGWIKRPWKQNISLQGKPQKALSADCGPEQKSAKYTHESSLDRGRQKDLHKTFKRHSMKSARVEATDDPAGPHVSPAHNSVKKKVQKPVIRGHKNGL